MTDQNPLGQKHAAGTLDTPHPEMRSALYRQVHKVYRPFSGLS
jgi:hypothetical protein